MNTFIRRLDIPELLNVRDLGGYRTPNGVTQWGRFLRADAPSFINTQARDQLYAYGVRLSVDLRSVEEVQAHPSRLADDPRFAYRYYPLFESIDDLFEDPESTLLNLYITLIDGAPQRWVELLRLIDGHSEGAVLYHCSAGKDRTGILTAFLLELCGVSRMDIAADYALTAVYMRPRFAHPRYADVPITYMEARPETIEALLEHVDKHYGGVRAYLCQAGLEQGVMDRLVARLTEE